MQVTFNVIGKTPESALKVLSTGDEALILSCHSCVRQAGLTQSLLGVRMTSYQVKSIWFKIKASKYRQPGWR